MNCFYVWQSSALCAEFKVNFAFSKCSYFEHHIHMCGSTRNLRNFKSNRSWITSQCSASMTTCQPQRLTSLPPTLSLLINFIIPLPLMSDLLLDMMYNSICQVSTNLLAECRSYGIEWQLEELGNIFVMPRLHSSHSKQQSLRLDEDHSLCQTLPCHISVENNRGFEGRICWRLACSLEAPPGWTMSWEVYVRSSICQLKNKILFARLLPKIFRSLLRTSKLSFSLTLYWY